MPRVTIVTSLYNHAQFLGERFRSIRAQTLQDWEWIIIDDASRDDSVATARRLIAGDNRIKLLVNDSNRGTTFTSARGFRLAKGEYLYRADSDDSCHKAFLATLVASLDACPQASFAACRSLYMNTEGRMWGNPFSGKASYLDGPSALAKLIKGNFLNAPSILYRRSSVENVGGFDAITAQISSDWHLNMRMCLAGDLIQLGQRYAYYRQHDHNISSHGRLNPSVMHIQREVFDPLTDIYRKYADHPAVRTLPPITAAYRAQAVMVTKAILARQEQGTHGTTGRDIIDLLQSYVPGFDASLAARRTLQERIRSFGASAVRSLLRA